LKTESIKKSLLNLESSVFLHTHAQNQNQVPHESALMCPTLLNNASQTVAKHTNTQICPI